MDWQLLDVFHEMHGIATKLDLAPADLPDFTAVETHKQDLEMRIWCVLLRLSVDSHEPSDIQAIDETGMDQVSSSQHYAKRTNYTFKVVKTKLLNDCKADQFTSTLNAESKFFALRDKSGEIIRDWT